MSGEWGGRICLPAPALVKAPVSPAEDGRIPHARCSATTQNQGGAPAPALRFEQVAIGGPVALSCGECDSRCLSPSLSPPRSGSAIRLPWPVSWPIPAARRSPGTSDSSSLPRASCARLNPPAVPQSLNGPGSASLDLRWSREFPFGHDRPAGCGFPCASNSDIPEE